MENKPFGSASGSRVPCHARSIGKKIAKLVILIVIVCNTICHNILLPLHCFHRNVVVHRYQIPHRCHCFILHIFRCRRFNCIFCLFRDSFKHVFFLFFLAPSSLYHHRSHLSNSLNTSLWHCWYEWIEVWIAHRQPIWRWLKWHPNQQPMREEKNNKIPL